MDLNDQRPAFYVSPRRDLPRRGSSDAQQLQISREAQGLNQMIDSWPTGRSFHGRNKEITGDLLRGALGLQESLIKLGKIEEACKFMAQANREHDCSSTMEEEFTGEMGMQATGSRRFDATTHHQHGLRAARNLRSSRNCVEELKKVIRDSLYRQNLVSISDDDDEKPSSSRPQKPSTGDDKDCRQKHETESSGYAAAAAGKKAARAPNLIARLMGLEEAPPEEFRPVRRPERRENSSRQRPFVDLEMPEVGKLPLMEESMQFKGPEPLKSGSIGNPYTGSPVEENGGNFPSGDRVPPAVIIKPVHSASLEMEEMQKDHVEAGQASVQKNFQTPALELPKNMKSRAEKAEKAMAEAKQATTSDTTRSAASSHDQKQVKKGASRTGKKTKETRKAVVERGTSEEKRKIRPVTASPGSQIKNSSSTPRKPEKNRDQVKNRVLTQKSTLHHENHLSEKPAPRDHVGSAKGRKVTSAKPVRDPIIVKKADTPNSRQENKGIVPAHEKGTSPSDLLPSETEHQCIASKRDISGFSVETEREEKEVKLSSVIADTRKKPGLHCEVLPKCSHGGGNLGPSHAPNKHPSGGSTIPVPAETFDHIKSLLLGCPCFLRRAQELFHLHREQPTHCRRTETEKEVADKPKLLLDCAGELMTYKHYHSQLASHPMWMSCLKSPVTKISMNQLVEEISIEIEKLGYSGGAAVAEASGDGLNTRWEIDVKCEGVWAKGTWEQGWSEAIPVEEGDGVICDVKKHILGVLVEEIVLDLVC